MQRRKVGLLVTWMLVLGLPGLAGAAPGDLDATFGPGGKVTTNVGASGSAFAVALQPDGKIVVAGDAGGTFPSEKRTFALARYTPNGRLDLTFGSGGKVTTDFGGDTSASASALAIQPDGKIVVAGSAGAGGGAGDFALARYNPDGSLDLTFGTAGKVTTDFGDSDAASALALRPDGRIVVAGTTGTLFAGNNNFALARYTPNGSLDFTFGAGGKVITDFGGDDLASALILQPDGRIVVAGSTGTFLFSNAFALARYNPDGGLDPTFGTGGMVTADFGGGNSASASALVLQPDGRIVVAGFLNADFALVRYTSIGTPDLTFGTGGRVVTEVGGEDVAYALALQPDGKIVAAGRSLASGHRGFALVRHNPDGSLDLSFGSAGTVTTDFDDFVEGRAVALQPDGKIVLAGGPKPLSPGNDNFALARYNANGSLDLTFRAGGKVTTDMGGDDFASALALLPDGKIVVAGSTLVFGNQNVGSSFALARYTPNGHLDLAFGAGGKVTTDFGADNFASAKALALQSDGKIVAAGERTSASAGTVVFALARYHPGGSLDLTFGGVGTVVTDFGGDQFAGAYALALQPDGKIVVAGRTFASGNQNFALARYNADGSLDLTFGTGGKVITEFGDSDAASALVLQPDGKILVAGGTTASGNTTFALARYASDGSLDPTFGAGGLVTTDFGNGEEAFALALQPDGRIVAAGGSAIGRGALALARYTPDGNLDPTFGSGGTVTTDFGAADAASALALQPDGKIVVTVGALASNQDTGSVLARYTSDGSLDVTFGAGGKVDADFVSALALQPDGKIVAAGRPASGARDFAIARYTGDRLTTFIATNQLAYHQGDLMTVAITTDPGLSLDRWYVVVAVVTPTNTQGNPLFVYRFDPVVELITFQEASIRPFAAVAARPVSPVSAESFTILAVPLPALPAGSYQWLTALFSEDLSRMSPIATAPFELSP